jgi:hypothetical protein
VQKGERSSAGTSIVHTKVDATIDIAVIVANSIETVIAEARRQEDQPLRHFRGDRTPGFHILRSIDHARDPSAARSSGDLRPCCGPCTILG